MSSVEVTSVVEDPELVRRRRSDQIVLIAHGWALKSRYFRPRLSIDRYIDDSLDILLGGVLTPSGEKRYAARKRRSA
jgi:hypothetical protein